MISDEVPETGKLYQALTQHNQVLYQQISDKVRSGKASLSPGTANISLKWGDAKTNGWMHGQTDEQKSTCVLQNFVHCTSNCTMSSCMSRSLKHEWQQLINELFSISIILCMLYDV